MRPLRSCHNVLITYLETAENRSTETRTPKILGGTFSALLEAIKSGGTARGTSEIVETTCEPASVRELLCVQGRRGSLMEQPELLSSLIWWRRWLGSFCRPCCPHPGAHYLTGVGPASASAARRPARRRRCTPSHAMLVDHLDAPLIPGASSGSMASGR